MKVKKINGEVVNDHREINIFGIFIKYLNNHQNTLK